MIATAPALVAMWLSAAERGGTIRESVSASKVYAGARADEAGGLVAEVASSPPAIDPSERATLEHDLPRAAPAKVREALAILERHASDDELDDYKRFVWYVADAVARAHREGGVLGIGGAEVSERERDALNELARMFDEPRSQPAAEQPPRRSFTAAEARRVGEEIGIDWDSAPFDVEQFRRGMVVELEHGLHDRQTNVTDDDPTFTGKIALAHLKELPDYYTRLERMESEAEGRAPEV